MKSKLFAFFLTVLLVTGAAFAKIELAPYYNYQFIEGVSVSPGGDMGFLVNLSNDIGTIIKPFEKHSFIGFYSIKYQGPGLKMQEGQEFSERYLDHLFVGRHHWNIAENYTVKSQFDIMLEGRRSGTNETWESGLYNFNRYGGSTALSRRFGELDITAAVKYHFMSFPNYTDLLAEIRMGADASASEGQQNHHIIELGAKGVYKEINTGSINLAQQLYTKQKVAVNDVQSDGTYYSSKTQKDFTVTVSGSRKQSFLKNSVVEPEVTFIYKDSNQNYQHFIEATSTAPVSFHTDYYDYVDIGIGTPFVVGLTQKWSFILSPYISYKKYLSRSPRDKEGNFIDNKEQDRMLGIYTVGFKNQIGESSSSMLFFTYQKQTSNMKFEKYVPYNYNGLSFGFKFQMEY